MTANNQNIQEKGRIRRVLRIGIECISFAILVFIAFQVAVISGAVNNISISDEKIDYVHSKVEDLVKILSEDDDAEIEYPANKEYEFKPVQELPATDAVSEPEVSVTGNAMREEISKMDDSEKLKIMRDKLIDIYQSFKERNTEYEKVKEGFYEVKAKIQDWYVERQTGKSKRSSGNGFMGKIRSNLEGMVSVRKVEKEDLSKQGKKVLTPEQIPEMLEYAEALIESGSVNQAVWIMEDVKSITQQQEIDDFTTRAGAFLEKYPSPNSNLQEIKDLIDMIENQD